MSPCNYISSYLNITYQNYGFSATLHIVAPTTVNSLSVCGRCLNCKLLVSIKRMDVKRVNEYSNELYTK